LPDYRNDRGEIRSAVDRRRRYSSIPVVARQFRAVAEGLTPWTNVQAIAEATACGYTNLHDEWNTLSYPEQDRLTWQGPEEPAAAQTGVNARRKSCHPGAEPGPEANHHRF
jgi:hypothetical protein